MYADDRILQREFRLIRRRYFPGFDRPGRWRVAYFTSEPLLQTGMLRTRRGRHAGYCWARSVSGLTVVHGRTDRPDEDLGWPGLLLNVAGVCLFSRRVILIEREQPSLAGLQYVLVHEIAHAARCARCRGDHAGHPHCRAFWQRLAAVGFQARQRGDTELVEVIRANMPAVPASRGARAAACPAASSRRNARRLLLHTGERLEDFFLRWAGSQADGLISFTDPSCGLVSARAGTRPAAGLPGAS